MEIPSDICASELYVNNGNLKNSISKAIRVINKKVENIESEVWTQDGYLYDSEKFNTYVGMKALNENTTGSRNTAYGHRALELNKTGTDNVAIGAYSLVKNIDGNNCTAVGESALRDNISGINNVSVGSDTLGNNETGEGNTAIGRGAGLYSNGSNNVFIGKESGPKIEDKDKEFSNSIAIGANANVNDNNMVAIGNNMGNEVKKVQIGHEHGEDVRLNLGKYELYINASDGKMNINVEDTTENGMEALVINSGSNMKYENIYKVTKQDLEKTFYSDENTSKLEISFEARTNMMPSILKGIVIASSYEEGVLTRKEFTGRKSTIFSSDGTETRVFYKFTYGDNISSYIPEDILKSESTSDDVTFYIYMIEEFNISKIEIAANQIEGLKVWNGSEFVDNSI